MRPLLPDDGNGTEAPVISYPTSTENLGRGIDLVQSGMEISNFHALVKCGLISYRNIHFC